MRVVTVGSKTIEVRGLTAAEIKNLKASGVPVTRFGFDMARLYAAVDSADNIMSQVFSMVLTEDEIKSLDALSNSDSISVWRAILAETFGSKSEEKN